MDDLISEFLTETAENLEVVDVELVKFEANPGERATLDNIFRLVHTIKGTCGFLGLGRLEAVAHAGETLLGRFRDGKLAVTPDAVTLVLRSIDRIKTILAGLAEGGVEPAGDDSDLIGLLEDMAEGRYVPAAPAPTTTERPAEMPDFAAALDATVLEPANEEPFVTEPVTLAPEPAADAGPARELRPGEVSLDELEAAFQAAEAPEWMNDPAPAAELSPEPVVAEPVAPAPTPPPAPAPVAAQAPAAPAPQPATAKIEASGGEAKEGGVDPNAQSIRVGVDVLEDLMTLVSELVLTRNQLLQIARRREDASFSTPLQRLSAITGELQDSVMKTRMQPIGAAWKKLPRLIRDLSHELGKKIDLVMEGEATELDRQVLELIRDPLTHMVRNSADHGLESTAERIAAGKPATGSVRLSAFHEGGWIVIRVADDGRGLNTDRIRDKIVEKGLATRAEVDGMTDAQVHRFIFAPGFSTAAAVTNLSGRGVGMDVVRTNIEQIGGQIDLTSAPGQGTAFTIKIPLTLAIVSALIVGSGGQRFAVPQTSVLELVRTGPGCEHRIERIEGALILRLRDKLLPLVELAPALNLTADAAKANFVLVAQVGEHRYGVVVEDVLDTEEIVVKPLAGALRDVTLFSGATILGDGSVVLIVEPNALAELAGPAVEDETLATAEKIAAETGEKTALLLVRAGGGLLKAVELSRVTRLEHAKADAIDHAYGRASLPYRGRLMPLLAVEGGSPAPREGVQPLLVFTGEGFAMGLAVDEIVDVVEDRLEVELAPDRPGVLGTASVAGRTAEVLDVDHYLVRGMSEHLKRQDGAHQQRAVA